MTSRRVQVVGEVTWRGILWASACGPALGIVVAVLVSLSDPAWLLAAVLYGAFFGFVLALPVGAVMGLAAGLVVAVLTGTTTPATTALTATVLAPLAAVVLVGPLVDGGSWALVAAVPVTTVAAYPLWRVSLAAARSVDARSGRDRMQVAA